MRDILVVKEGCYKKGCVNEPPLTQPPKAPKGQGRTMKDPFTKDTKDFLDSLPQCDFVVGYPDLKYNKEKRVVPASNFCGTLSANVDNENMSDKDFRQFVRNTLPIVIL